MTVNPKNFELLLNEIFIQKTSYHPNIVEIIKAHSVGDQIWLIMEFMEGGCLTSFLEARILFPECHIAYICLEVSPFNSFFKFIYSFFYISRH